ncbi:MAG: glycine cleavage system protein GcvH [Acidobacteria bacterium]|nr:glycine cleavage system protein GcvH [Acidobacteriota bacterium]
MYPEDLLYSEEHEWISIQDHTGTIGITDYAQSELGDVVFVELPHVGDKLQAKEPFGSVESVKAVSEVYSPVSGEIVEVNDKLADKPEMINDDPYGNGWMVKVRLSDPAELEELFSAQEYEEYLAAKPEE